MFTKKKNPGEARFSAPTQTGSGAHPASCTMGTGAWCWPPSSSAEVKKELSYTSTHPMDPPGPVTGFPLPLHDDLVGIFLSFKRWILNLKIKLGRWGLVSSLAEICQPGVTHCFHHLKWRLKFQCSWWRRVILKSQKSVLEFLPVARNCIIAVRKISHNICKIKRYASVLD